MTDRERETHRQQPDGKRETGGAMTHLEGKLQLFMIVTQVYRQVENSNQDLLITATAHCHTHSLTQIDMQGEREREEVADTAVAGTE